VPADLPLFESLLVFENTPDDLVLPSESEGLAVQGADSFGAANYPLVIEAVPGRELALQMVYDADRFDEPTIRRALDHLCDLLAAIAAAPEAPLASFGPATSPEDLESRDVFNESLDVIS